MNTVTQVSTTDGISAQTGKAWRKYNVTLDDGRQASGFSFVKPGDTVNVEQKGQYLNFTVATGKPVQQTFVAGNGKEDPRHYMMRAANLLKLSHDAARAILGDSYLPEDARCLFIEAARNGYVKEMPDKPVTQPPQPQEAQEGDSEPF